MKFVHKLIIILWIINIFLKIQTQSLLSILIIQIVLIVVEYLSGFYLTIINLFLNIRLGLIH